MKAYKGFNKNMTCKGYQYEENKEYECEKASLCNEGFHACEYPLDCLNYYNPAESVYHEVEIEDNGERNTDDTKVVGKKIKIGASLTIRGLVEAAISFVKEKTVKANSATGYLSANSATGSRSANSATGYLSANSATGYLSANSATGSRSANSATGSRSANSATGYGSANITTGIESTNEGSEATLNACWGKDSKCRGKKGAYLVLSEWGDWDGDKYPLLSAKMIKIDGKRYKEDIWYQLKDGKVVNAEEIK